MGRVDQQSGGAEGCSPVMKEQERASNTTETEEKDEGNRMVKGECRGERALWEGEMRWQHLAKMAVFLEL